MTGNTVLQVILYLFLIPSKKIELTNSKANTQELGRSFSRLSFHTIMLVHATTGEEDKPHAHAGGVLVVTLFIVLRTSLARLYF